MFRIIANGIKGRTKSIDEKLSIPEVLNLLNGLDGNVRGSIWREGDYYVREVTSRSMIDLVNKEFVDDDGFYKYAKHQVYSGERDEKHYLRLYKLIREASDEITMKRHFTMGVPTSIKFIIEKSLSIRY